MAQSPYKILNVSKNASDAEIKKAYKKKAMQCHPDKGGDEVKFKQIANAYESIKNAKARHQHEHSGFGGVHINTGNFNDIFGDMFQQRHRKPSIRVNLQLQLEDLVIAGARLIQLNNQVVEIEVPPGVNDGDTIRYPQPNGMDLLITYRIQPNKIWERQGLNLIKEHKLDFWDLIVGTETNVITIHKQQLKIKIPPMSEPGALMRLKGQGLNGKEKDGDMFIKLIAKLPKNIPDSIITSITNLKN